ncbi:hypothetical protein lerEdw1_014305 [Lerista edwardsae]|nr:hypothetical protein lerEdw1_014307 [Lerista edwardsae]KAJ6633767.1 hypothetical protein lerEdw1_014305 [Lerista edwardsae]
MLGGTRASAHAQRHRRRPSSPWRRTPAPARQSVSLPRGGLSTRERPEGGGRGSRGLPSAMERFGAAGGEGPAGGSEQQARHYQLLSELQALVKDLPSSSQQRLSYTTLSDLALALLDGTVFEIVQGLLEIQHLTERNLLNQRLKLHTEHRGKERSGRSAPLARLRGRRGRPSAVLWRGGGAAQLVGTLTWEEALVGSGRLCVQSVEPRMKQELLHKHREAQQGCQPHNLPLLKAAQQRELESLELRIHEEQQMMDEKIVLELDQKVVDQQSTLEKAGVSGFYITTNPQELTLQMNLLELIRRLQQKESHPRKPFR